MSDSTQHWLDRNRPPRVQITYDVEIGDAIVKKEIPFVVGVMADLSGSRTDLPPLRDRKYVEIDRDNFNEVMTKIEPQLSVSGHDLKFSNIDDFNPAKIIMQVDALKKIYEARTNLADLLTKLDGNVELDAQLQKVFKDKDTPAVKQLKGSVGGDENGGQK